MTTVDTTTSATATAYSNQQKLARTANGNLWVAFYNGSAYEFHVSTDGGATWTHDSAGDVTAAAFANSLSLYIDVDDFAHIAYVSGGPNINGSTDNIFYRRGTPNDDRTAWTWSDEQAITVAGWSGYPAVVAHREGNGWVAHIVSSRASTGQLVQHHRVAISASGAISVAPGVNVYLNSNYTPHTYPVIDFHHTGDGKTVQGGTPHLYVAWTTGTGPDPNSGILFRKATYSAGTWTWGTTRVLDPRSTANGRHAGYFDGTRFVLFYRSLGESLDVRERDAADTTTTARTPPALSDGTIVCVGASYDQDGDIHLLAVGDTSDDVKRIEFDRSAGTWDGSWTTVATADAVADTLSTKRGYAGDAIEVVYVDGTASPWNVEYAKAVALNVAPTAPTWNLTNNQAHDVNATLTLPWTFNDPNDGDSQSAYALRRQIGAASVEYWNAGTSTWGATEVKNTSSTEQVVLASGWGADSDDNHKYAVKTWDAAGLEGTYSDELTVIPSAKVNPSITSPADAGTVTVATATVAWTVSEQTQYRARLLTSGGSEIESSGWVTSTNTSHTFATALKNSTAYKVEITTRNNEGLVSDPDTHSFSTAFTPPATPTLTVTPSSGALVVNINNPAGGATVTGNDLYVRVAPGGTAKGERPVGGDGIRIARGVAVDGSYTDYAVASGTHYEYRVRAHGDNGTSADSNWTA